MTDGEGRKSTQGAGADSVRYDPQDTQTTGKIVVPSSIAEMKGGPALTILCHPNIRRVGDRAVLRELLSGGRVQLSRMTPAFAAPGRFGGSPLDDKHISRQPIQLSAPGDGGIRLDFDESRIKLMHRGATLQGGVEFSADEVMRGVVLEITGRVVLLLHHVGAAVPDADEPCGLVGESDGLRRLRWEIQRVANLETPVLLRGETGTGKELVARAIHRAGARRDGPFVPVNLAAIPFGYASAELFGAGLRASDGNAPHQLGYFNLARGGTLFLDEVADAPPPLQAMLFRALETGEIQGLGDHKFQKADVRVIAATSADLEAKIADGSFRESLLHRLVTYEIWVPPLRERRDDIGRLLIHFLREELERTGEGHRLETPAAWSRPWLPPSLVAQLAEQDWVGNVRQLRNVVRQLVIGSQGLAELQVGPSIKRLLIQPEPTTKRIRPVSDGASISTNPPPPSKDDQDPDSEQVALPPRLPSTTTPSRKAPHAIVLEFSRVDEEDRTYEFRFEPQSYKLRTGGGQYKTVRIEWNKALLDDLQAVRSPGRDPAVIQRIGDVLSEFLATADWNLHEQKIQEAVEKKQLVFLTIRSAAAELYALPWELLTLKASGHSLGEMSEVLVRYEWPETRTAPESDDGTPRPAGGRILVASSGAGGAVPRAEHMAAIQKATEQGYQPFDAATDVLPHASYGGIEETLKAAAEGKQPPISVLHLLCHGGSAGETFGLVLQDDDGSSVVVDAKNMGKLLGRYAGMVRLVVVAACDGGNIGELGNHLGSVAQMLHRAGIQAVIASRFPLSREGSIRLTEALYQDLLVGSRSLEEAFLRARAELALDTQQLDWASLQLYSRAEEHEGEITRPVVDTRPVVIRPYRGLLPFKPKHSRFFFGRDAEISELVSDVKKLLSSGSPRLMVVVGASGIGKSSLVLAGVVPRLLNERGSTWTWDRIRPGSQPCAQLDQVLKNRLVASPPRPYLLVVDQFDEIFQDVADPKDRTRFAQALWKLASDPDSAVSVIITLRRDFIDDCAQIELDGDQRLDTVISNKAHHSSVPRMGPDQIRKAIEEPARAVGLVLSDGLVSRILEDVGSEPGILPLIQDTMDLLWRHRRGRTLSAEDYHGVTEALRRRADALIAKLDRADPKEREAVQRLLVRLVSMDEHAALGTRRRLPVALLRPSDPAEADCFDRVVTQLVNERLLVKDVDRELGREIETLEVAHETLIRKWESLREWVKAARAVKAVGG